MELWTRQVAESLKRGWAQSQVSRRAARTRTATSPFSQSSGKRRLIGILLFAMAFLALKSVALGQLAQPENPDNVFDTESAVSTASRLAIYGLGLVTLCVLSLKIPDAPLLFLMCSMPIIEFSGLRIALGFTRNCAQPRCRDLATCLAQSSIS